MVLEVGVEPRRSVLVGAEKSPVAVTKVGQDEVRAGGRGLDVVEALECRAGVRQRGYGERVPCSEALVVEPRSHAGLARSQQPPADLLALGGLWAAGLEHVGAFEVPAFAGAEVRDRLVREVAELAAQLVERPHVVATLDALRVGVQGRGEAALGPPQLAE